MQNKILYIYTMKKIKACSLKPEIYRKAHSQGSDL